MHGRVSLSYEKPTALAVYILGCSLAVGHVTLTHAVVVQLHPAQPIQKAPRWGAFCIGWIVWLGRNARLCPCWRKPMGQSDRVRRSREWWLRRKPFSSKLGWLQLHPAQPRNDRFQQKSVVSVLFAFRRVILLRSDICYASGIRLRRV